jgi:class III poly(R)-hydroxyalkanoic acid synthase PhaE subunit
MTDNNTFGFDSSFEPGASPPHALHEWLRAQREMLDKWSSDKTRDETMQHFKEWWQGVAQRISPSAQDMATQIAALGPSFAAGATSAINELFGAASTNSAAIFDAVPVGFYREHQERWQALARALENQRRSALQMSGLLTEIHGDALERLTARVTELESHGERIDTVRRLYDLWIECGEVAFAKVATQERFARLQGEMAQAFNHVRAAQEALAEYLFKQLDLPTRSELNTVHRSLRALRARIDELERAAGSTP